MQGLMIGLRLIDGTAARPGMCLRLSHGSSGRDIAWTLQYGTLQHARSIAATFAGHGYPPAIAA